MRALMILFFLLIACTQPSGQAVGHAKIEMQPVQQNFQIIEEQEVKNEEEPFPEKENKTTEKTIMQKLLENSPSEYWYWEESKGGAAVKENMRREVIEAKKGESKTRWVLGKRRWDTKKNTVWEYEKTLPVKDVNMKFYVEKPLLKEDMPKSPIDWMKEYQFEKPLRVIDSPTMITLPLSKKDASVNLTLTYRSVDGKGNTTFFIHEKEKVPVRVIDEKTTNYEFGRDVKKIAFDRENITDEVFELDEREILLTPAEMKEYESQLFHD